MYGVLNLSARCSVSLSWHVSLAFSLSLSPTPRYSPTSPPSRRRRRPGDRDAGLRQFEPVCRRRCSQSTYVPHLPSSTTGEQPPPPRPSPSPPPSGADSHRQLRTGYPATSQRLSGGGTYMMFFAFFFLFLSKGLIFGEPRWSEKRKDIFD